jgi:hypothetical protein
MKSWLFVAILAGSVSGCAEHQAPQVSGDPSLPSVGWVIMHGHDYNPNEEFGCQSTPRSDCWVHASVPTEKTFSEVHVYFHPAKTAKTETTYSGTVKIGFFSDSATSSGMKVDATVKPGDVGNHSVVGVVTDKPGRYVMNVDVTAVARSGIERHIQEDIPIDVQLRP